MSAVLSAVGGPASWVGSVCIMLHGGAAVA